MTKSRTAASAVLVMLAWWIVAYGFGALPLPWLQPSWFPQLGVVMTNALALLAACGAAWLLWRIGWIQTVGMRRLAALVPPRIASLWWTLPLLAITLSWIFVGRDGVPGIVGTPLVLLGSAVAMFAVGFSEEAAARGLALGVFVGRRSLVAGVVVTSVVFGLWHLGNAVLFGQSWDDTWWQVLGSAVFGMSLAGVRLVCGSLWPAIVLHALQDWCQLNSPGAAPFWFQVVALAVELVWGGVLVWVAVRRAGRADPARTGAARRSPARPAES